MNKPLSCGAEDMLEAVIVQKRRINLVFYNDQGEVSKFPKVLPVDIGSQQGKENLTFMTTDNLGGIIKLSVNTADILSFEADDFKDPRIQYAKDDNLS
ncbi:hypothetical protein MNBD_GAMMA02-1152 [hydrothermal vent metagenome]|uniref:Uncharacterized protein n=1 Tax=hydrothermal vent metagenome TaxID=652676 RepID=A0A3B0W070_9ZZZZ